MTSSDGMDSAGLATVCAHVCCSSRRSGTGPRRRLLEQDLQILLHVFRARMLVAESGLKNAQRPLTLHPRAGEVALRLQHDAEIDGVRPNVGVVRAVRLIDPECPLKLYPRAGVVALRLQHAAEIVSVGRYRGMRCTQRRLADPQRSFKQLP